MGMFGENFITEGLAEDALHVGDRLQIGSATVMVRQPRVPCYKLAAKFQRDDILQRFLLSGRSGFYFSVEQEGEVSAGDSFEPIGQNLTGQNPVSQNPVSQNPVNQDPIDKDNNGITIEEMNRLFAREKYNRSLLQKAIDTVALPQDWREYFLERLERPAVST